jgi:ribosomal protein S18 acetylase RimI-like enzyme
MIHDLKPPLEVFMIHAAGFNLQDEYGDFLQLVLQHLDEADALQHHGVKGMKWGVRKQRNPAKEIHGLGPSEITVKTKRGETLTLSKDRPNAIARFMARHSEKYLTEANNFASLTLKDSTGKKVGEAQLYKKNKDEINLIWLGVKNAERGKGYASATMQAAVEFGKQAGVKKLTLEVPGNSPDARHIYEKLGFKVVKEEIDPKDTVWGGLSNMVYKFDAASVKHFDEVDAFFEHHGVKGMKWGERHAYVPHGRDHRRRAAEKKQAPAAKKPEKPPSNLKKLNTTKEVKPEVKKYFGMTKKQAAVGATVLVGMGVASIILKRNMDLKSAALLGAHLEKGQLNSTLLKGELFSDRIIADSKAKGAITFPLGHQFSRMSSVAEKEVRNGSYASFTAKDMARYTATWGDEPHLRMTTPYKHTIEALGEIKAPSLSERFSTMAELVDKKHPDLGGSTLRQWLVDEQTSQASKDWVKQASTAELGKFHYGNLAGGKWDQDPIGKAYMAALRNKGYSIMTDDRDSGNIAESAMVLINKNMFKITQTKALTSDDIMVAKKDFQRMLNS